MQICIAGRMHFSKKNSATCSFQIGTKNPKKKKFIVEPSFFTSWTIAGERCTRAHAQENKSIYVFIYISLSENLFENGCTRDDAVVRAPISHQCDSSLNPGIVAIWGSLLCSETFSLVHNTPAFPSPENQHFQSPIAPGM